MGLALEGAAVGGTAGCFLGSTSLFVVAPNETATARAVAGAVKTTACISCPMAGALGGAMAGEFCSHPRQINGHEHDIHDDL